MQPRRLHCSFFIPVSTRHSRARAALFTKGVFSLVIAILYQRKPRPLQSVLRFTRRLAYTCLSLDVFSTVAVISIAASNRIAHLVFDAISPFTVAIAPAIYSSVTSHSAVLFGSFSVIEALGGMFSVCGAFFISPLSDRFPRICLS